MKLVIILVLYFVGLSNVSAFEFNVLHTNDLHSYFEGSGPDMSFTEKTNDGDIVQGHYARLAYQIKKEKSDSKKETLLLDAGDFFAGTLFHALAPNKDINIFPEAEFFRDLGYDATTFGNHEFDARDDGLMIMLDKWTTNKVTTPIISTNAYFKNKKSPLKKYFGGKSIVRPYIIKELVHGKKKLRVGIIGLLGPDGALVSLGTRKTIAFKGFDDAKAKKRPSDLVHFLRPILKDLKSNEKVDLIIGLMHGGDPEDRELLEQLPDISLLVAGHTHQVYTQPVRVGNSLLVQAGSFGNFLGKLKLKWDGAKLHVLNTDTIINIDDSTPVDTQMHENIAHYKTQLDQLLAGTGFRYDSYIFTAKKSFGRRRESLNDIGVLVTSAVRDELNKTEKDPIDLYFTAHGLIRKNITEGHSYQFSDIFKILAIGFDENLEPGGNVVSFYLNKSDVFNLLNFMEVYGMISSIFSPAFSNSVSYHDRWWGIPFVNKLGNLKLNGKSYSDWPPLIRVASSQYVAAYLPKVKAMSYGMLEFVARDKQGQPLKSPTVLKEKEYALFARHLK